MPIKTLLKCSDKPMVEHKTLDYCPYGNSSQYQVANGTVSLFPRPNLKLKNIIIIKRMTREPEKIKVPQKVTQL